MYIYAYKNDGVFYGISSTELTQREDLIAVPTLPEDPLYRWENNAWVKLTEAEIKSSDPTYDPSLEVSSITTPTSTRINQICCFGNEAGDRIIGSPALASSSGDLIARYINVAAIFINNSLLSLSSFLTGTTSEGHIPLYRDGGWRSLSLEDYSTKQKYQWSFSVCRNATKRKDDFLPRQNGTPTDRNPYSVPYNCICHAVSINCRESEGDAFDLIIYKNGIGIVTLRKPEGVSVFSYRNLKLSFLIDDRIAIRLVAVGDEKGNKEGIDYPGASLYFIEV